MTESKLSTVIYDNNLESKYYYLNSNNNSKNTENVDLISIRKHKKFLLNNHNSNNNAMASSTNSVICSIKKGNDENELKAKNEHINIANNNEQNNPVLCNSYNNNSKTLNQQCFLREKNENLASRINSSNISGGDCGKLNNNDNNENYENTSFKNGINDEHDIKKNNSNDNFDVKSYNHNYKKEKMNIEKEEKEVEINENANKLTKNKSNNSSLPNNFFKQNKNYYDYETFSCSSGVSLASVSEKNKKDELKCSFSNDANNLNINDINNTQHLRLNNESNMILFNQEKTSLSTKTKPAEEADKFKINTRENNINFNSSSKFINKKKSYIIMNSENEQSRIQQMNSNIKINVTKSNSTGSYSSDNSTSSSGIESSSSFNDISLKSKSDLTNKSPSSSSISSYDSVSISKRKLVNRKNQDQDQDFEMEDNSDSFQDDESNCFNDENEPISSNEKSINYNDGANQINQSFDSDLNYEDEDQENSEIGHKRKNSKSDLESYCSMVRKQNEISNEIITQTSSEIINSLDYDSHTKNKIKRIKSNVEHSSNNENDLFDFKNYLARAISEILTSQMTLTRKVDKIKSNFFYINKKLKEIEISMNKESFHPETTSIQIQVDSDESENNGLEIDKKTLSVQNSIKNETPEKDYNNQSKSLSLFANSYSEVDSDSKRSSALKTATLNPLIKSQSALTKCNSAPPPIPFNFFNNKNSVAIQPEVKHVDLKNSPSTSPSSSKKNMIQESVSSSSSTPISSSRRLVSSMSARLYGDQSDHSSNPYHTHQQNHHHNSAAAAAAVALNHATMTANLNKLASNYSLQKDFSSSYSPSMYPYSQFFQSQQQNNNQSLQQQQQQQSHQLQKNSSSNNLDLYKQSAGLPLYLSGSHNSTNHLYSSTNSSSKNSLLPHHHLGQVSSKQSISSNSNSTNMNKNSFSTHNPYHHLTSYENPNLNQDGNTNKTTALAAAAALAAAFAAKSNGISALPQQSLLRMMPNDIKNGLDNGHSNKMDDNEYDSPDDEKNNNNMFFQAKDHAVQTFNLLHHSNHTAIRHIPSSAVDQLELSNEIESLVSRDLIKRCIRKAKHRGNFAANLTAELFTKEERISCNCTGTRGKRQLSPRRLNIVKEITFKIYNSNAATAAVLAAAASGNSSSAVAAANSAYQDFEEAWRKECITAIDAKNRSIGRDIIKINSNNNTNSSTSDLNKIANSNHTIVSNVMNSSNDQNIPSPYSDSNHPNETSE